VVFEALGFLPGDLLVEINGQPLSMAWSPVELVARLNRGDAVIAKIKRGDELTEVELRMH
jgi:S1-C subfamily serine protease